MTVNFDDLSVAQLTELKQKCENLLKKRHTEEIGKALNKLYSAIDELDKLDPCACVFDTYDWDDLKWHIINEYTY